MQLPAAYMQAVNHFPKSAKDPMLSFMLCRVIRRNPSTEKRLAAYAHKDVARVQPFLDLAASVDYYYPAL